MASVSYGFWEDYKDYTVKWEYDKESNQYKRFNGGEAHKDLDTEEQLMAKNVVVIFTKESNANDGYERNLHLLYGTTGEGKAIAFQNGEAIEGKWVKKSRLDRMKIFDDKDKEVSFVEGKIWISNLPIGVKVDF